MNFINPKIKYPFTKKINQSDDYFGITINDPYRWLEETDSEEVKKWIDEQNKVTFNYLEEIPYREKIKQHLTKIWNYPRYYFALRTKNHFFYYKNDGLQKHSVIYIQKELDSEYEIFLDPNTFSDDGSISLQGLYDSKDGNYLAYSISKSGSDWLEIFVMEINSKKKLPDHLKWIKYYDISWYRDGFFYSRYVDIPVNKNIYTYLPKYQKIFYHKLGTSQEEDILIYEDSSNPDRENNTHVTEDEKYLLLITGEPGKRGNSLFFKELGNDESNFKQIVNDFDHTYSPVDNIDNHLLIMTNKDAPKFKLMLADLNRPYEKWKTILPEKDEVLNTVNLVDNKLIASYTKDVLRKAYVFNIEGKQVNEINLPAKCSAYGFNARKYDKKIFYTVTSMVNPPDIYIYDIEKNESILLKKTEANFNPDNYEYKQIFYKSSDGVLIPMFILHKKGIPSDGSCPAFLTAYGGFGLNEEPYFGIPRKILLENNFIIASANIRGGGEYGEQWHEGGMLLNKQQCFDDFISAAQYLFAQKYTNPKKLVIEGISNGGLLMGAVINQRPDICKVAIPEVGVMDMLRFHKFTAGKFWISEYGSPEDPVHFKNLLSYSPLHNVREIYEHPAILVLTADHDDRVVPSHSFKYIAALQQMFKGNEPVLIRIEKKAGHGFGTSIPKLIQEYADKFSFIFYNLGIEPAY